MKLTIVAATGGVGGHVLRQALDAGHTVTAVVRRPASLPVAVPAATVDLAKPDVDALDAAVGQADAVISALGPRGRGEIGIVTPGTREIVDAMQRTGTRRLVAVSGAGVSTVPTPDRPHPPRREPGAGWVNRYVNTPLARRVLGEHFVDVAMMEHVLRESSLDWTAIRAPLLTDGPLTRRYRTARGRNVRRGFRLSRADTAHLMLEALDEPDTHRSAIAAAY